MGQLNEDRNSDNVDKVDDWEADSVDFDSDLEYTSVSIGLDKTGEQGSGYHTRNDPSAPFQRATVAERRGIIEVQCKSREVIHGALSADADDNATLLVYDLLLDTTRRSRRIVSATLEFEFSSTAQGVPGPQVHAIAPEGRVTLLASSQQESLTRGAELKAGGEFGASLGGTVKWEKTIARTTNDDARVTSRIFCDEYGREVGASFVVFENRTLRSGAPSFLRCAVLLKRHDDSNFQCKVRIKAEADWKSEVGRLFGSTPHDDPVLFDPSLPPTNKLRKSGYDTENLGSIDLDEFVEIRFHKGLKNEDGAV